MIPLARIDWAGSSSRFFSNVRRGWSGFGSMRSIGTSVVCSGGVGAAGGGAAGVGRVGSSAPRPLPSALREVSGLFMVQNLFGELNVALGTAGSGVVGQDRLAEAGGLRQANAARNHRLENLVLEEAF